jgi:hypothetical protein
VASVRYYFVLILSIIVPTAISTTVRSVKPTGEVSFGLFETITYSSPAPRERNKSPKNHLDNLIKPMIKNFY